MARDNLVMAFPFSPSLVIFDCDGELVDTEPVANRMPVRVLAAEGLQIGYEKAGGCSSGGRWGRCRRMSRQRPGRTLGDDWPDHIRDETLKAFADGVEVVPAGEAVPRDLQRWGVAFRVASSGKFEKMRFTLGGAGLLMT